MWVDRGRKGKSGFIVSSAIRRATPSDSDERSESEPAATGPRAPGKKTLTFRRLRGSHEYHFLCSLERVRSSPPRRERPGTSIPAKSCRPYLCIRPNHRDHQSDDALTCIAEPNARIPSLVRISHQLALVPPHFGHSVLEQDRRV